MKARSAIVNRPSQKSRTQMDALTSEAQRRRVILPDHFIGPDRDLWERGYAAEAGRSLLPLARALDDALVTVRPFLDPVLDGSAHGRWDPKRSRWVP